MKRSFLKHDRQTCHWHCKLHFWIGAYCVLEKSSSYYLTYRLTCYTTLACSLFVDILSPVSSHQCWHELENRARGDMPAANSDRNIEFLRRKFTL